MRKMAVVLSMAFAAVTNASAAGTGLSISPSVGSITCNGDGTATAVIDYLVTSAGGADAAALTYDANGGTKVSLGTIAAGNVVDGGGWTFNGRYKTYSGEFSLSGLANGTYDVEVCAVQNGSPAKGACSTVRVVVNCTSTDTCATTEAFGDVPSNKNLCSANGNIEVQFRGSFGPTATLVITGPSDSNYSKSVPVARDGDSCNYHYNWDASSDNGGPGTYTFDVTGNSHSLEFGATLSCNTPGPNNQ